MSVKLFLVGLILRTLQIYENPIAWNSVAHIRENYKKPLTRIINVAYRIVSKAFGNASLGYVSSHGS